ncbi:arylsulfatase I-like isoform X2 [Dunckerocampus dactyliophorus]|uniref:arylsulfatase I-like isoform X2 n=1 Tax=Dunckerocampus dactyliophorus TaxID=161453 RepID=UPI002404D048|nr:arylsulfatase I-like isoform X2 [Dunckerocampus dactyliophorus]
MQAVPATFVLMICILSLDGFVSSSGRERHQNDGMPPPKPSKQPHIIFILIDDQGFNDIGYHNPAIKTPTLDKLAAEGVKLENYYVQPICTPSRSQLLTGRYQIHTGLQHSIIRPSQPSCLPLHMDTLPERLRQAGYATHMVGKWHLGFYRKACLPTRKGFDTFFGSLTGSVDYYSYGSCDGPGLCGYDLHDNEGVAWGQEGKYSTTLFTQRARKILESHAPRERPLFLLLSLQAVHTPLQPPKSYIYPYRHMANVARRKFAAMVSTVDEAVRNVTYALRKYGFYRNSVIIYSTDNGAQPFTGGSNWPLRGRKGTYWEGGVRGVAFVHSPLLRRRRRVSKALLHITDWFPTLVGLAGGNVSQSLDGYDVWSAISEGKKSPRQEILYNIDPLHKPPAPAATWDASAEGAPVAPSKAAGLKKPKKKKIEKLRKQRPKQKSAFKLPKFNLKAKNKQKLQSKSLKPHLKVQSAFHNLSITQTSHHKQPGIFSSKSRRTTSQEQNLSWPQTTKTKLRLHLKSKRTFSQQNVSQPDKNILPTPPQSVWDTSVQAAIRVGDWKMLTGDPGHGEWVPPQVLPTLPGRWWNLERAFSALYRTFKQKNIWLFNISADPYERRDLAEQRPDVVQQLLSRLAYYNRTAVPVYFPPDDPRADPSLHGGAWVPWVEEEDDEEKYEGIYKKVHEKNKKKRKKCRLCKLKAFFLKLNTRIMSSRI